MIVPAVVHGFFRRFIGRNPDVIVADDNAAVSEIPVRETAGRIAKFMHDNGRIDKIIEIAEFPDGGGFEELMPFVAGSFTVGLARHEENRLLLDGQHIFRQEGAHRTMARGIKRRAETGIKPGLAVLRQDAGIELRLVPFAAAEEVAVPVVYMAVEFVFAGRLIADRDGNGVFLIQDII